jgi:hypothetical protein
MTAAVVIVALVAAAANAFAGGAGAWSLHRGGSGRAFWVLVRVGQVAALVLAVLVGALAAAGQDPSDGLFYLYALAPLVVGLIGEQLRVASAETVLAARGLADARAVGSRPEDEQRSIVQAVLGREIAVMTVVAFVVCFLELRAAGTASF